MKGKAALWNAGVLALAGLLWVGLPALVPASRGAGPAAGDDEQTGTPAPSKDDHATKVIKMYAENWKWTPKTIRVKQGTRLVLKFKSYDAPHSFVLKTYNLKVPLPQDSSVEAEFVADKKGTFRWRCGRPCGDGCRKMTGKLIVE